jgi:hypothetical protein
VFHSRSVHPAHFFKWGLALILALAGSALAANAVAEPEGPGRTRTITVQVVRHSWWLSDGDSGELLCTLAVDHDGLPTRGEVLDLCGGEVYQAWLDSPACDVGDDSCQGVLLHEISANQVSKQVVVQLEPANAEISLQGCQPVGSGPACADLPTIIIDGIEPLPNESIEAVRGTMGGLAFDCAQEQCALPLQPTGSSGRWLSFWAVSSFGDASEHYTAKIRVAMAPGGGWNVDVLSSQWRGSPPPSCAAAWGALPPAGGLPAWLTTPGDIDDLQSSEPYAHLADEFLNRGWVDAGSCPSGGRLADGSVSACGLRAAQPAIDEWQNRFDLRILTVANARNVPAQLLKNIFAQESQFWPAVYENIEKEYGFGKLTADGADTTLLWNRSFFDQFCPLVLSAGACDRGYSFLLPGEQELLRGALVQEVDATCGDCPSGIDLRRADSSVSVFAETLLANCEQVGRMVANTTGEEPGDVASYVDLWRLTVANYNGGPGCVGEAIEDAWDDTNRMQWDDVVDRFSPVCQRAADYVSRISAN